MALFSTSIEEAFVVTSVLVENTNFLIMRKTYFVCTIPGL